MVTIYALKCKNGFVYVGCTAGKIQKRMREHRCLLNQQKHKTEKLQADWNTYGEQGFMMATLETFNHDSVAMKRSRELHWLRHYSAKGLLYNEHIVSFSGTPESIGKAIEASRNAPRIQTAETNEKRRLAQLGKPKNHGDKISATKKRLGQKPSLEAASAGGKAACKKRYEKIDEIV